MNKAAPNPYLRSKIMTASPEELRLMLFDGCLKFCRLAQAELEKVRPSFDAVFDNFMRAQKIVLELSTSLNHRESPELCEKLSALYTYVYRLLVDGNMQRDPCKVEEAIRLIGYERETWVMLMAANADAAGAVSSADPCGDALASPGDPGFAQPAQFASPPPAPAAPPAAYPAAAPYQRAGLGRLSRSA